MASYPQTPVAFPTRLPGAACDPSHWNLMTDEVAAWEKALMTASAETQAPMRPRGLSPALEWGHFNTAGYGSTLAPMGNFSGAVLLLCEPGSQANTFRTRGMVGSYLGQGDLSGTLVLGTVPNPTADNQQIVSNLWLQNLGGCHHFPSQPRLSLEKTDNQSFVPGSWLDIVWNVTLVQVASTGAPFFSSGAAITIPIGLDGTYLISVTLSISMTIGYTVGLAFNRQSGAGGAGRLATIFCPSVSSPLGSTNVHLDTMQYLTAGDVYSAQLFHNDVVSDPVGSPTYLTLARLPV